MDNEYWINRNKDTGSEVVYSKHSGEELNMGEISRDKLDYLGEWRTVMNPEERFGFVYRMGMKEGLVDEEGDPAEAYFYFVSPVAERGHEITDEEMEIIEERVEDMMNLTIQLKSTGVKNTQFIAFRYPPTGEMLKDLEKLIRPSE